MPSSPTHIWVIGTPGDIDLGQQGFCNALLLDDMKPLPEPMLIYNK